MPATKSLRSGTWARTLLPISRSAGPYSAANSRAARWPKNRTTVGTPLARAAAATLAAGSTPRALMPLFTKFCSRYPSLLASSTTRLRGAQIQALDHPLGVLGGVLQPTRGERRKIGIIGGEDFLRWNLVGQLHQKTFFAHESVQRIERLHQVYFGGPHVPLAQRARAQVHKSVTQRGVAKAAAGRGIRF